jgi:hypothetical protein
MNVSTTSFSAAQMILAWTLILLLSSWFIIFTALSLRDFIKTKVEWDDIPTPSRPIPIISVLSKEEHQNLVEMAGGAKHHEHPNTERASDRGTSSFR